MPNRLFCVAALLLAACNGDGEPVDTAETVVTDTETTDTDLDTETGTPVEDCGANAPEIVSVTPGESGMVSTPSGGTSASLQLEVEAADADGDLHEVAFEVDVDPVVDGTLDPAGVVAGSGTAGTTPCEVPGLLLQLGLVVDGVALEFDQEYEFGLRLLDAAGNVSETYVFTAITPHEDGSEGDGI